MKILMFINPYLNLVQPVIDELKLQGHEVITIDDFFEYYNPMDMIRRNRLNGKRIMNWNQSVSSYWRKHENIIAEGYDMFISFNGGSINGTAFELINKYSPKCIKIQYAWDSFNTLDLNIIESYFDRSYTFDIIDAENSGWILLPSFYVAKDIQHENVNEEYDLFMIGSNHDRRYSFIRKVLHGLKHQDLNNYIKIYVPPVTNLGVNLVVDCIKSVINLNHIHEMLFKYGVENNHLKIDSHIELDKYTELMNKSKCILDDTRPGQAGLSPRFIRAMALNKKVITTNKWAYQYSFVDRSNVTIVEKDKPKIDIDFLRNNNYEQSTVIKNLDALEISNWVKILIGEKDCPSFR